LNIRLPLSDDTFGELTTPETSAVSRCLFGGTELLVKEQDVSISQTMLEPKEVDS